MIGCIAVIRPLDTGSGTRVDVRVSSFGKREDADANSKGGERWIPAMVDQPALGISLWPGDFTSAIDPAAAAMQINLGLLAKAWPDIASYAWMGAPIEIYAAETGDAWPWPTVFAGKVSEFGSQWPYLTLQAQVNDEPFQANVLTAAYAGTGAIEGGSDLKGKPKPLILGWAQNVEPILINTVDSIYQFSGYGAIEEVTTLYERGSDFGAATGDYPDYAALLGATIPPGRWATCLAHGLIRLGAPQAGIITGDIKGHKVGATTPRLTGAVISALATLAGVSAGVIEAASLTTLDADKPYPINVVITDQSSFIEWATRLAICCNWQAGLTLQGKFFVTKPDLGAAESIRLDAQGKFIPQVAQIEEQSVSPPYYRTTLGAVRCWRVHSADEIAFDAALIDRGRFDPAEFYRYGNIVDLADGSRWLYINETPTSGNAPPDWPTTSNAWWENMSPPTQVGLDAITLDFRPPRLHLLVSPDGTVQSYTGAESTLSILSADGTDISADFTLSIDAGGNPSTLATTIVDRTVTITGGYDTADPGSTTLRVIATGTGGHAGYIVPAVLHVEKNQAQVLFDFTGHANDRNALVPDAPTLVLSQFISANFANGNVSIGAAFNFTLSADPTHKNSIDGFEIGVYKSTSATAYVWGTDTAKEVWRQVTFSHTGPNFTTDFVVDGSPEPYYHFAVRAARGVQSDIAGNVGGFIRSAITSTASGFRPNSNGAYVPPRNRNSATPVAPTLPTLGACINHALRTDGAVDLYFNWLFGGAEAQNTEFEVGLYASTSPASYTPGFSPSIETILKVPMNKRVQIWTGCSAVLYYTLFMRTVREVDVDIAASGKLYSAWVKSAAGGEDPYQPYVEAVSTDAHYGSLAGTPAASVAAWSGYAANGLNPDGSVKAQKINAAAVIDQALLAAGWGSSGGLFVVNPNETASMTVTSNQLITTSNPIERFRFIWALEDTNPVQNEKFSIEVRGWATKPSSGQNFYSDWQKLEDMWQAPNYTGSVTLAQHETMQEFRFSGLPSGTFNFGFEVRCPAGNGARLPAYRYARAEDWKMVT